MALKLLEPKEPVIDPRTEKDQLENVILYMGELIDNEIRRGNDLCEIIYVLMEHNGPSHLTKAQRDRISSIKRNIEAHKSWLARTQRNPED